MPNYLPVNTDNKYLFAENDRKSFGKYLQEKHAANCSIFILMDENTNKHCKKKLTDDFPVLQTAREIIIRSGEINKNIEACNLIWKKLIEAHADRHSLLLNLGGGVITDIGGFAASVYKRGITFCNIPTTLLAMTDAAAGGKTGINFQSLKNVVGSFRTAEITYIDTTFLKTLPSGHMRSGFAELLKIALVADKKFWKELVKMNFYELADNPKIIQKALALKEGIVSQDPEEKGLRKLLNFGHTIGHSIESYSLLHEKESLLHGEAVAIGILCEAYISYITGMLPEKQLKEIAKTLLTIFGKYKGNLKEKELLHFIMNDKKSVNSKHNFTLLKNIGEGCIDNFVNEKMISASLQYYAHL